MTSQGFLRKIIFPQFWMIEKNGWKMDPLEMYFLLKMGIFQPAMLVYQRVKFPTLTTNGRLGRLQGLYTDFQGIVWWLDMDAA